jgi:hypothetical protein
MSGWLKRDQPPLTGGRPVRREKTYSAETGFVYRYVYCGQRAIDRGTQYVFEVSRDRRTFTPISIFLSEDALASWQTAHGRELTGPERYAVAKMALFQAFDRAPDVELEVVVQPDDVASILETLGRD